MSKHLFYFFILTIVINACQPDENKLNKDKNNKKSKISIKFNHAKNKGNINFNEENIYNQTALFLSGKESKSFSKKQNKKYYKKYSDKVSESWNKTTGKNLKSINKWIKPNGITNNLDTLNLFYPFSGPDFLYANAFFPHANNYIFIGLENPGKLPNLTKMTNKETSDYLVSLLHSLRYINKAGYFTTKQMQDDFNDESMNGIIHLLLFYLSKTNHNIIDISIVLIDNFGNEREKKDFQVADGFVNGIKIEFFKAKTNKIKKLYYFPIDLSNENLKDQLGFLMFLSKLGYKNTFMKSASYILHDNEFSVCRNLILKQSKKILQDDSGIPYKVFKNSNFKLKLFGNYSRTIKTFEKHYQPDLHKALKSKYTKPLKFKIGYNSWKNETVLMFAERSKNKNTNRPVTYKRDKEAIIYKVQIKSSWKKISLNSKLFEGLQPVDYYFRDGLYKYTVGNCSSQTECEPLRLLAVKHGFEDAFVVAFYRKNRISLEKAEELNN